jgi:hypothetical protein
MECVEIEHSLSSLSVYQLSYPCYFVNLRTSLALPRVATDWSPLEHMPLGWHVVQIIYYAF